MVTQQTADDTGRQVAIASTKAPGLPLLVGVPASFCSRKGCGSVSSAAAAGRKPTIPTGLPSCPLR